jgi:tetraacyldisaccharide 4'-kinase
MLTIGDGPAAAAIESAAALRGLSLFRGTLVPDAVSVAELKSGRVLAFAGIGDPEKFFATLNDAGIDIAMRRGFPDHHRFTAADAESLVAQADRASLTLVTTEKDWVRLGHRRALARLAERSRALPVALQLEDEDRFRRFVLAAVAAARA